MVELLSAVAALAVGLVLGSLWARKESSQAHLCELARLMYAHEQAMLFLRAGSATEKVQADSAKKSAELQLKILEDALAMEQDHKAKDKKERNPEPKWVSGYDAHGEQVEVNLAEGWEIQA